MHWSAILAVATLATPVAAAAKEQGAMPAGAAAPTAQHPPQLPPEGKRWIESFVGRFRSNDVSFTMGDKPVKGKMELDCRRAAGGWAATCTATMTLGKEKQQMALLYGWSVADGMAHLFEVTNMGDVHDHAGKWDDDKTITVVHRGKSLAGKQGEDSLTFARVGAKQMRVTGKGTEDGAPAWTFAGTFTKR